MNSIRTGRKPTICAIASIAVMIMFAIPAAAGDREDAAKEFDLGQQSDKAGNFTSALDHYLKSYELIPHPATAYNIASNYEKLGKARQAAQYFTTYLEQDPKADDKEKVKKKIADLQNLPARVVVRSSPPGAQITVDGGPQAREPIVLSLKGGDHEVVATLQGQTQTQRINAQYGEQQEIVITFGASTAVINVWSTANNTTVSVDGAVVGTAPLAVTVPAGQHQVTGSALGYVPQTKAVVAQAGRAEQVSFSLLPASRQPGGMGASAGTAAVTGPSDPGLKFVFGFDIGTVTIKEETGNSFMLHSGIRISRYEVVGTLGSFSTLKNATIEPGDSELVRGGAVYGLSVRTANFIGRGLRVGFSSNLLFNSTAALDARIGLMYQNLLNATFKADLYAEVGVGVVGRLGGVSDLYIPVTLGLTFHR